MGWDIPSYDAHAYNLAGKALVMGEAVNMEMNTAYEIINNWRSSHYRPLNTFQKRLRRQAQDIDGNSLVVQRIKRLYSIKHKLERFPTMRLTQIQDIAGCRAIVSTVEHLEKLVNIVASRDEARLNRGIKHKLIDEKDYIKTPKPSGYRGVHLIFKYKSDKVHDWDDMRIEIQFRTIIQHAWATAVETVGIFIGQALKSSIGEADWLRFFALASSAMASYEGCPLVPNINLTPDELRAELRRYYNDLDVPRHLRVYKNVMNQLELVETAGVHYYLLELDTDNKKIKVVTYKQNELEKASGDYLEIEKNIKDKNADAVLVSADSISALKRAYPNYFLDTEAFLNLMKKIIA